MFILLFWRTDSQKFHTRKKKTLEQFAWLVPLSSFRSVSNYRYNNYIIISIKLFESHDFMGRIIYTIISSLLPTNTIVLFYPLPKLMLRVRVPKCLTFSTFSISWPFYTAASLLISFPVCSMSRSLVLNNLF